MSVLNRIFGPGTGFHNRGSSWYFPGRTYTGETVNVETALTLVPVWSAVSQIAGSVGMLPLPVYRQEGDFRSEATSDHAWALLHDQPNPEMAADELWELVDSHIELWGNAFLWKKPDPELPELVGELWPVAPWRVQVSREEDGTRGFWVEGEHFTEDTILHIRGFSEAGLVGYSPIQMARNALAVSQAQEKFQGTFMKNEGKPSIVLTHPNALKPEAVERLKASWDSVKAGGTAVLEEDVKVQPLTMPLEDAQFMESMNFSDKRIAQIFLLPPSRLGAPSGDSLTYKTTESENQRFISGTLQRRLKRIEASLNRDAGIITNPKLFCEFQVDELLRSNMKERFEAYKFGVEGKFMTAADIRRKENLPELDPDAFPPSPVQVPVPVPSPPAPDDPAPPAPAS